MAEAFDPYRKWLGIPPEEQPPNHYRLLGIGLYESDADVIEGAADRQMAHVQRHQLGQFAVLSQKVLNELSAAKLCLLMADRKDQYDQDLRKHLAAKAPPQAPTVQAPPQPPAAQSPAVEPPAVQASAPGLQAPPTPPPAVRSAVVRSAAAKPAPAPAAEAGFAADTDFTSPAESDLSADRQTTGHRRAGTGNRAGTRKTAAGKRPAKRSGLSPLMIGGGVAGCLAVVAIAAVFATRDSAPARPAHAPADHPAKPATAATSPAPETGGPARPAIPEVPAHEPPAVPVVAKVPAEKPAVSQPETGDVPADVTDLLALIKVNAKTGVGKWQKSPAGLVLLASKSESPRIVLPYAPPNEYQLELVVEPQPGAELILGLIAGGKRVAAVLDGWGGQTSGLDQIDGASGQSNSSTHAGRALRPQKPNLVVARVRGDSIKVTCDAKTVIDWQGPFERLSPASQHAVADQRALFIGGGSGSAFRIRSLRLATLSGNGQVLGDPRIAQPQLARVEPQPPEPPPETPAETPAAQMPATAPPKPSRSPRPPAEPASARAAVPAKSEIEEATKLVRDVFADDFKQAKRPAEKIALAEKLVKQADDSQTEIERYALLSEARSLALAGGSPTLAIQVVEQTGARFEIDTSREIIELVDQLSKDTVPPAARKELAEALVPLAEGAVARADFESARRLLAAAAQSARRSNDPALIKQITARSQEVADSKKLHDAYRKALDKLAESPDDPQANLAAGRYLCLSKQDWDGGLPYLAKGSDDLLRQAAALEMQPPGGLDDQVKLGDLWWALVEQAKGSEKSEYAGRCEKWYSAALPGLKGLTQTKVSKRIEELVPSLKHASPAAVASGGGDHAAGGDVIGSAAMVKLAAKIKLAIRKDLLMRSVPVSGRSGVAFAEVPQAGGVLVGFNYTLNGEGGMAQIMSLQPIYATAKGTTNGDRWGADVGLSKTVIAKKGYAVAGLRTAGSGTDVRWFDVIFARLGPDGLDMSDKYTTPWTGTKWLNPVVIGDNGQLVVGIYGAASPVLLTGLGLVQLPDK